MGDCFSVRQHTIDMAKDRFLCACRNILQAISRRKTAGQIENGNAIRAVAFTMQLGKVKNHHILSFLIDLPQARLA